MVWHVENKMKIRDIVTKQTSVMGQISGDSDKKRERVDKIRFVFFEII